MTTDENKSGSYGISWIEVKTKLKVIIAIKAKSVEDENKKKF